jgi:hypothetical protein
MVARYNVIPIIFPISRFHSLCKFSIHLLPVVEASLKQCDCGKYFVSAATFT